MGTAELDKLAGRIIEKSAKIDSILRLLSLAWVQRSNLICDLADMAKDNPEIAATLASIIADLRDPWITTRALAATLGGNYMFPGCVYIEPRDAENFELHDRRVLLRLGRPEQPTHIPTIEGSTSWLAPPN